MYQAPTLQKNKSVADTKREFEKLVKVHHKNFKERDIKGFHEREQSISYVFEIKSLENLSIPNEIDKQLNTKVKLSATFHISLFYKDLGSSKETRFFFGRTVQTEAINISGSNGFGFKNASKPYFIHSNIPNLHNKVHEKVVATIEVVVRGENLRGSPLVFSGGYCTIPLFNMNNDTETIDLLRGSPRDLMDINAGDQRNGNAQLRIQMIKYPKFDNIQNLVPQNNFVCQTDIIPGLGVSNFPTP